MRTLVYLGCLSFIFAASPCYAARQYRCDGRVQYRPCETQPSPTQEHAPNERASVKRVVSSQPRTVRLQPVRVEQSTFTIINSSEGLWRGRVRGNGVIHLLLEIHRNGQLESSRYMGNIRLVDQNTSFSIRSALPAGRAWSWKILAYSIPGES